MSPARRTTERTRPGNKVVGRRATARDLVDLLEGKTAQAAQRPLHSQPPVAAAGLRSGPGLVSSALDTTAARASRLSKRQERLSREIAQVLDAALPDEEEKLPSLNAAQIERALESALPESKGQPAPSMAGDQPKAEDADLFEIVYDSEINCLIQRGHLDPRWVPTGIHWMHERPGAHKK